MSALLRKIRIDAAVAMTVMQRVWGVAAGLVMVLLTSTLFSKEMQGYYYTFSSLIALQAFFELGLNFVLAQFVSHDTVLLDENNDAEVRQAAIDRIGLLYNRVRRWFAVTSMLFAVAVGSGGFLFLRRGGTGLPLNEWLGAWLLIVVAAAVNLYYSPQIAIAEGTGKVARVAKLRTLQSVGGYLTCWVIIAIHPTLYAMACIGWVMALTSGWWLHHHSGVPKIARDVSPGAVGYGWRKDIFPLQWRIGLSWMSGYLLYQAFTPFTFAHRGPAEAAMIGLSLAMFSNISLIGMSWLSATTPVLAGLVARGERETLRRRFKTLFVQSLAFQIAACTGLCIVVALGRYFEIRIMDRFLPTADLTVIAVISSCNVAVFAMATFMRVHKEEPMLWNSLVCGVLVTGITYLASFYGAIYVLMGYLTVIVLLCVPWTVILFRRYWYMR